MGFTKTTDRLEAMEQMINLWLQDGSVYCNNCDLPYCREMMPCCEDPQIGTNKQHMMAVLMENEMRKELLNKDSGANQSNTMRISLSIPPRLYQFLKTYFERYGEKFPKDNAEIHRMMRRFKRLCIARTV